MVLSVYCYTFHCVYNHFHQLKHECLLAHERDYIWNASNRIYIANACWNYRLRFQEWNLSFSMHDDYKSQFSAFWANEIFKHVFHFIRLDVVLFFLVLGGRLSIIANNYENQNKTMDVFFFLSSELSLIYYELREVQLWNFFLFLSQFIAINY